jgi:hypothetical protein
MANLNKTLCNCEATYNEETGFCDPLLPNSPNPCPDTAWGNIWSWIGQNVSIGGGGGYNNSGGFNYTPPGYEKKDNTIWYVVGGVVLIAVVYFATKKK